MRLRPFLLSLSADQCPENTPHAVPHHLLENVFWALNVNAPFFPPLCFIDLFYLCLNFCSDKWQDHLETLEELDFLLTSFFRLLMSLQAHRKPVSAGFPHCRMRWVRGWGAFSCFSTHPAHLFLSCLLFERIIVYCNCLSSWLSE